MKKLPLVAIIVSNYNGASIKYRGRPILERCLSSLKKTAYGNFKVIVADGGSKDNSKDLTERVYRKADFIVDRQNGGFAKGNNMGIKYSIKKYNPEYFLLINNDAWTINGDWLSKLVHLAEKDKDIGIEGCKLLYPDGSIESAGVKELPGIKFMPRCRFERDKGQYETIEECDCVSAPAMMIRKEVFKEIGFLDENFFNGLEDVDFFLRAKKNKIKMVYNGKVKLIHLGSFTLHNKTLGKKAVGKWSNKDYYSMRNFAYLINKHRDYYSFKDKAISHVDRIASTLFKTKKEKSRVSITNLKLRENLLPRIRLQVKGYFDGMRMNRK